MAALFEAFFDVLFGNWSWAGAEFLGIALVATFVVSRFFWWLTKGPSDRFSRILISNGLSLVICAAAYGVFQRSSYDFHYMHDLLAPLIAFLLPQGFCLLFDVISETRWLSLKKVRVATSSHYIVQMNMAVFFMITVLVWGFYKG
jgi:hypothetical protein